MTQHVLNTMLQRGGGGRAARAGTLHVQPHHAVAIAAEHDIAAIAGHGRAHAGVEQFLDLRHDLSVLRGDVLGGVLTNALDHRAAGDKMLHDGAQHLRAQRRPGALIALGDGDELGAEEHAGHAVQCEQGCGERAAICGGGAGEIGRAGAHHVPAREELQGGGVGRAFGLDKHRVILQSGPSGSCTMKIGHPAGFCKGACGCLTVAQRRLAFRAQIR